MEKVFEDYFSEIQSDMVAITLEYVEGRAEKIFIYCSFEENVVSSEFFYKINGQILKKNKLNNILRQGESPYDVSIDRQKAAARIINDDIEKLIELCTEYKKDMPTQIKLIYDIGANSLNADYRYDLVFSEDLTKGAFDALEEWFEEESKNC